MHCSQLIAALYPATFSTSVVAGCARAVRQPGNRMHHLVVLVACGSVIMSELSAKHSLHITDHVEYDIQA